MAYEVIKEIRGRPYRYRVESYRDPATGKVRAHWTYVGRGEIGAARSQPPRRSYAGISAGAIATEAGFAHGTFYRQFRDKRDALDAALERVRAALAAERRALAEEFTDAAGERERFRAWVRRSCTRSKEHRGLFRAWFSLTLDDPEVATVNRRRSDDATGEIVAYLDRLAQAGYAPAHGIATAEVIVIAIKGALRRIYLDDDMLSPETIEALAAMLEATVFGAQ